MTNDILYRDPATGNERNLPEGTGEKLGFERVAGFAPPELEPEGDNQEPLEGNPIKYAIDVIETRLKDVDDLSDEEQSEFDRLVDLLRDEYGIDIVDHRGYKDGPDVLEQLDASAPAISAAAMFAQLTERIEKDDKISKTGKEAVQRHLRVLLSAEPASEEADDTSAESTTNPKESDLPGKAAGETANSNQ